MRKHIKLFEDFNTIINENKIKLWNPDYLALGDTEFAKLKRQDKGYKFGKTLTVDEYKQLRKIDFNEKDFPELIIKRKENK